MTTNRQLFLTASTTANQIEQIVERQLEPIGIPGFLLALLTHVRDLQPVAPSGISSMSGVPMTTLRDNVQRLVDRRLVRRAPNPADGRSHLLTLTKRGETVIRAADPALLEAYLALEARLERPLAEYERTLAELNRALADVLDAEEPPRESVTEPRRARSRHRRQRAAP
jgi:DNA-binding MarR family transcriptional regulator